jgi:hypothetical protein
MKQKWAEFINKSVETDHFGTLDRALLKLSYKYAFEN